MRIQLIDIYEISLTIGSMGILAWFVEFMDREYNRALTRNELLFILGSVALFIALLWLDVEPKSARIKLRVILYGAVAGAVVAIGLIGWSGLWLPPVPGG